MEAEKKIALIFLFISYQSMLLIIAQNVVGLIAWSHGSLTAISLVSTVNRKQLALCI